MFVIIKHNFNALKPFFNLLLSLIVMMLLNDPGKHRQAK